MTFVLIVSVLALVFGVGAGHSPARAATPQNAGNIKKTIPAYLQKVTPSKPGQYPGMRLALYDSEEAAKAHWDWAVKSHPAFARFTPVLANRQLKRGMFVALFLVGEDVAALSAECAAFTAKGGECLITPLVLADLRYALTSASSVPKIAQLPSKEVRPLSTQRVPGLRKAIPEKSLPAKEAPQKQMAAKSHTPLAKRPFSKADRNSQVRLVMAGDVMMGNAHGYGAYLNPRLKLGAHVSDVITPQLVDVFASADLALVNLEGTLFDGPGPAKACRNCFAFRSPAYYASFLRQMGIDGVSLANNHAGDFFEAGRQSTLSALDRYDIQHAGGIESELRTTSFERNGLRVGFIAFGTSPDGLNIFDITSAKAQVAALALSHDIVVVSVHGGAEGVAQTRTPKGAEMHLGEYRGNMRLFTHAMIDAGADLVFGHGPHVARGLEMHNNRLIAYSLGNFWTSYGIRTDGNLGVGPLLDATLDGQGKLKSLAIHSTRQVGLSVPRLDP